MLSYLAAGQPTLRTGLERPVQRELRQDEERQLARDRRGLQNALLMIQTGKPLSFREKKMLDRARHMVVMETSIAKSVPEPEAIALIAKALANPAADARSALESKRPLPQRLLQALRDCYTGSVPPRVALSSNG